MYAQLCLIIVFGIYLGKNYVSLSPKSVQNGLEYSILMNIIWLASFLDIENLWFFFSFKYLFFFFGWKICEFWLCTVLSLDYSNKDVSFSLDVKENRNTSKISQPPFQPKQQ